MRNAGYVIWDHLFTLHERKGREKVAKKLMDMEKEDILAVLECTIDHITDQNYKALEPLIDLYLDELDRRDPMPITPIEESWAKLWARLYNDGLVDHPDPPPLSTKK